MSEEKVIKINYAGNSHRKRDEEAPEPAAEVAEKPRVEKLEGVSATVRKKSLGRKIAETFNGDDAKSVGDYVLFDVFLPSAKELIVDVAIQALERKILGSASSSRGGRRGSSTGINYNSISKVTSGLASRGETIRDNARSSSRAQNYEDITFPTRGQAEEVLENLSNVIEDYGVVRVADLHSMLGITGPFTDVKFGWESLAGSGVKYYRGAYILELPRPSQIN